MESPSPHSALQIDVLRDGHLITARCFDARSLITVGRAASSNALPGAARRSRAGVRSLLPLVYRPGEHSAPHSTDETMGSVALRAGAPWSDLQQLSCVSSIQPDGYDLDLEEGAQGRVTVGRETLVFHVIRAPAIERDWSEIIVPACSSSPRRGRGAHRDVDPRCAQRAAGGRAAHADVDAGPASRQRCTAVHHLVPLRSASGSSA